MTRREALAQSARWAGVAALWASLPARTWAALDRPAGWSDADETLLTQIGDTIIPATPSSPGAGAVAIGRFMITQATDCLPPNAVETLRRGLVEIQAASRQSFARAWEDLTATERENVLTNYEARPASGRGAEHPFRLIKELTLLGYFTSEPGATQALRYLPVPGGYRGSLHLGKDERSWAL